MFTHPLQPNKPIEAIIFDCDGTLSHIEGIDELAMTNGVGSEVSRLTAEAMGKSGLNPELYQQRLQLVLPNQQQVIALANHYWQTQTPDSTTVIAILKSLGKKIYIVSAGLLPAVAGFGVQLGIPTENVFAVPIEFDSNGNYRDFDHTSPLIDGHGKCTIAQQLKKRHNQLLYIGDGLNDYQTSDIVTRFVGYGGAYYRENIKQLCQYYITADSMMPLLPLCLTTIEVSNLTDQQLNYYNQGLTLLRTP